ncbi:MAG: GNAT family N-acetyltransferase [Candidatus Zixiibacteriota bacterium]|nr:MAG: GNAT family N-acetyltransferase [candidate division Zixibacteria bacterium]
MPILRAAQPSDIHNVRLLLETCNLPDGGIEDQFGEAFVVAVHDGEIIGVAGTEKYGECGLLRSIAVSERHRGKSVGRLLTRECLARAWRRGISEIYLLTNDAQEYFGALGFKAVDREQVPHEIAESHEYASLCPETATVMVLLPHTLHPVPKTNP